MPLTVVFTNLSSGATNYTWAFGDGNTSTAFNPSVTYSNAGTYSVTLTGLGAGGVGALTLTNYIVVTNAPPLPVIAGFTGQPTVGVAPLSVTFANLSSGANSYTWAFGDGNGNSAVNPSHTYGAAGTYSVTLTAVGPGGINTLTLDNYIVVTNVPVTLEVQLTSPAPDSNYADTATIPVNASVSSSGSPVVAVGFYVNGALTAADTSAPFSFNWTPAAAGLYQLSAVAMNDLGNYATSAPVNVTISASSSFAVQLGSPAQNAYYLPGAKVPLNATVTNAGTSNVTVRFYVNATLVATDGTAPYAYNWTPSLAGLYQVSAIASNTLGNTATSAPVSVTVVTPATASLRWANSSQRLYVVGPGSATLSQIKAALPSAPLTLVDPSAGVWYLGANMFIQSNAQLKLYGPAIGGDVSELRLKSDNTTDANAIIELRADWGWLDIRNTKIMSWDNAANGPDLETDTYGRAYVRARSSLDPNGVTARESRMDVISSEICYLGSHDTEAYGLVWKVVDTTAVYLPVGSTNTIFDLVNVYGDILNSRIHHNFFGVYSYGQYGGQWKNNEVDNNVAYGFDPHDDSDYLAIENNNVHHNGWHGIIASKRCDHGVMRNNVSWNNGLDLVHPHGNGLMLHRSCNDWVVENNTSFGNADSGIAIFACDRTLIRNNICLSNSNAGIRLSVGSDYNWIEGNEFGFLQQYGFYLYEGSDQPEQDDEGGVSSGRCGANTFTNNYVHDYTLEAIHLQNADTNTFAGNTFSGGVTTLRFESATNNLVMGNVLPANTRVLLDGSATNFVTLLIRNQPALALQLDQFSTATLLDNQGAIFDFAPSDVTTFADSAGSSLSVTSAQIGTSTNSVVTRNFLVTPGFGSSVLVNPSVWNTGGAFNKAWVAQAASDSIPINYTVGDLQAGVTYNVYQNAILLTTVTADAQGYISFAAIPGTTAVVAYSVSTP